MAKTLIDAIRQKQERIAALRSEIENLQAELEEARTILAGENPLLPSFDRTPEYAFTDTVDLPQDTTERPGHMRTRPIREGSTVWWAEHILRMYKRPMHIDKLVREITHASGKTVPKPTIVSNLSRYVKQDDTFTRPAESTYGLKEFEG